MENLIAGLAGGAILITMMWLGFQRWSRHHWAHLSWAGRGLLLLVLMTFSGGLIGALFWWLDLEHSFAWDLPPLASRMLAAAGWAFAAASLIALQNPTRRRMRLVLLMLVVYLTPLLLAILALHLDRFDFGKFISYAFFGIVLLMTIPANYYLFSRQPEIAPDTPDNPPAPLTRGWLILVAIVTGVWGAALFLSDNGDASWLWVWPGDALTSSLIGVMLLTLTAAALYGFSNLDVARMALVVLVIYGIGLAVASGWNLLDDKPIKTSYVVVFGVIGVVSLILLLWDREGSMEPTAMIPA